MFVSRVCCHKSLPFCGLLRVQKKEGWLSTRVFPSFGKNDISSLNNTAQTPPPRLSNDADSISQCSTQVIIVKFIESLSWLLSFVFMLIDSGAQRAQLLLKICCKVVVVSPCNWLFVLSIRYNPCQALASAVHCLASESSAIRPRQSTDDFRKVPPLLYLPTEWREW